MGKYVLSREAFDDLDLIRAYIEQDNPDAATRVIGAAHRMCRILAEHPELGRLRKFSEKSLANLRSFVITDFPNYIIFYQVDQDAVRIVRVLHGARNFEELF